jgi:hypothetical protein
MRKVYLSDFLKVTSYNRKRYSRPPIFYLEALISYVDKIFANKISNNEENYGKMRDGLAFFMGSLFYPKRMKCIFKSQEIKKKIEELHKSLYSFSILKLDYLYQW